MFVFYRDTAKAEEVAHILENSGVKTSIVCACVKDYKQEECLDFGGICRAGVYVDVPSFLLHQSISLKEGYHEVLP